MTIGELIKTRRYDVSGLIPWQGSTSRNYWFRLCVDPPSLVDDQQDVSCDMAKVMYRRDLMMTFWKHRREGVFVDTDGPEMLKQLHEAKDGCFFDLSTSTGREEEYASYWTLAWICAHNPYLWARWAHWEKTLFQYRVQRYFFKERHAALLINHTNSDGGGESVIVVDDPGDRERELYTRRTGGALFPTMWMSVPVRHAGRSIAESPDYDVDQGRVIITHHDFVPWIWSRMELAANGLMKRIFEQSKRKHAHHHHYYRGSDESNAGLVLSLTMEPIVATLDAEGEEEAALRLKRRAEMMMAQTGGDGSTSGGTLSLYDAGKVASLLELAKRRMPPCMARHVWRALVYKQHPKNEARLSLVKFLLEAGYVVEEAERVIYLLYEADTAFVRQHYNGHWTIEAFKKEYGGQVKQLNVSVIEERRIGAYGCATLASNEKRDKAVGCPFAMSVGLEARAFLAWAGTKDIEDVMKYAHPQERCCKYYQDRHPDKVPLTIRHPNQFFRCSNGGGQVEPSGGGPRIKREKIQVE